MNVVSCLVTLLVVVAALIPAGASAQPSQVRHMVVFKFKPGTTPSQVQQVTDALRALKDKIPG